LIKFVIFCPLLNKKDFPFISYIHKKVVICCYLRMLIVDFHSRIPAFRGAGDEHPLRSLVGSPLSCYSDRRFNNFFFLQNA